MSAVAFDDALDDRQADAGAFKFLGAVQALEDAEQFVGVFHIETDAVVADENDGFIVHGAQADFNDGGFARPAVFDGIGKQVGKDLFEKARIAIDGGQFGNAPFDIAPLGFAPQFGDDLVDNGIQRRAFFFSFPAVRRGRG